MGAVARHELAAAVSEAGGLGTIAGAQAPICTFEASTCSMGHPFSISNLTYPEFHPKSFAVGG